MHRWRYFELMRMGMLQTASLPRRLVHLWNFPTKEARVILEQDGDLTYFTVPARLQKYLLRGGILTGSTVCICLTMLLTWSVTLQVRKDQLEQSHAEIYAALIGSSTGSKKEGSPDLDRSQMLVLAKAIRDRDMEIRRYVNSATTALGSENSSLSSRIGASGLTEMAVRTIQASLPKGGFLSGPLDIQDPLLKGRFAEESALNQSLKEVLLALPSHMPVSEGRITSEFGIRTHPITGVPAFHAGVDLVPRSNDNVYSAKEGIVILARHYNSYGNTVIVKHASGIETLYAHLASVAVQVGQEVNNLTLLGTVGNTGQSTGKHLHFEVTVGGYPVDPMKVIQTAEYVQQAQK